MSSDTAAGWLAVTVAVVSFGSFAVPIKWDRVRHADPPVHPFVFQTYKSIWVFITCWLVLLWRPLNFTWLGVVSAAFWVPAGAAYVVAVDNVGVGITQAIVSSLVITVSTLWGLFFFHEPIRDGWLAALAFSLLAGGVGTMAYFSTQDGSVASNSSDNRCVNPTAAADTNYDCDRDNNFRPAPTSKKAIEGTSPLLSDAAATDGLVDDRNIDSGNQSDFRGKLLVMPPRHRNRMLGFAAAAFNGLWGGSVMVPLKIASTQSSGDDTPVGGVDFVVSFGVGVAIITCLGWLFLAARAVAAAVTTKDPLPYRSTTFQATGLAEPPVECATAHTAPTPFQLPSMRPQLLMLPGALVGITWSIGNFASMFAVLALGEAIGYSACQAAVLVSGLWGLLYFKEAPRGQLQWIVGALSCTSGIVLLAHVSD